MQGIQHFGSWNAVLGCDVFIFHLIFVLCNFRMDAAKKFEDLVFSVCVVSV